VYQAGTLSGNPIAMTAGLKALELLSADGVFDAVVGKTRALIEGLRAAADKSGVAFFTRHSGAMFGIFFTDEEVHHFSQVKTSNEEHFKQFFHHNLDQGVYYAPSLYEAGFVSLAHSDDDIAHTLQVAEQAFAGVQA